MVLQKQIHVVSDYHGLPKESDFKLHQEEITDEIEDGEFFFEALYVSVDPYMRAYTALHSGDALGKTVSSLQLARVTKSKNPKYPVGAILLQNEGWCNLGKSDGSKVYFTPSDVTDELLPAAIGTLGMPGLTAYIGLMYICKPKEGETVMISGAAGAVGNVVGQIAKIKGCRVIGSCGSDEKVKFLKSIGYDDAFNYKTSKLWQESIKKMAPNGIDMYFDNVGGDTTHAVMQNMNKFGRIASCGSISGYNATSPLKTYMVQPQMVSKELSMVGFLVGSHRNRYNEAYTTMKKWIEEGKLKPFLHVTEGFENLPKSFIEMLEGKNTGKAVVKV